MKGFRAILACLLLPGLACCSDLKQTSSEPSAPTIRSLSSLSIEALRERRYNSQLRIESVLSSPSAPSAYAEERGAPIAGSSSYMASYYSDELRVYARIDVPASAVPVDGYPVVLFLHGYIGIEQAPNPDLLNHKASYYSDMLEAYTGAGYLVITPGFRGHGTVSDIAAEGIEYLSTWDAGSYVSPLYYAIDTLNLLEGLNSLTQVNWSEFASASVRPNLKKIYVVGHSQGGDVALTVLAVAGENSTVETPIAAASIWAGCIGPRLTQLASYFPMQSTAEAFLDGSGQWTGRAVSNEGEINPNFVFGFPPEWIESPHPEEWTWQNQTWKLPGVSAALELKTTSMYDTFRTKVEDLQGISFKKAQADNGRDIIVHDPRVIESLAATEAGNFTEFLSEPLVLQFSDRDMYSPPAWNQTLCASINANGQTCDAHLYEGSTHSLKVSDKVWFSPAGTKPGFPTAIARDLALFRSHTSDK